MNSRVLRSRLDLRSFVEAVNRVAAGQSVIDPEVVAATLSSQADTGRASTLSESEREVLELMARGCQPRVGQLVRDLAGA